jgi:hypothetical protein
LTEQGVFSPTILDSERGAGAPSTKIASHHHDHAALEPQFAIPPGQTYIRKENSGQGYYSCGWLFGAEVTFDFDQLYSVLSALTAERVKGVVNTSNGCMAYNISHGVVSVNELSLEGFETRIEVIDSSLLPWDELEQVLLTIANL